MSDTSQPAVTVLVPCRDEERFIGACLDSILNNDYPKDRLEILVIDGMSQDGTRASVSRYSANHPSIRLLDNLKQDTPHGLNLGIAAAIGDIIVRMDAHSMYPKNYISRLVAWLSKTGADNVGGVCMTVPANDSPVARAIARGLSHPFGVGTSYFRIGTSTPRWVDTVFGGCYRRDVFARIGLFDEQLIRNQDDEFNHRLIARGGRILLVPDVVSYYYPRSSLAQLWRMFYQYGYFKPLVALKLGRIGTGRQVVPMVCLGLLVGLSVASIASPVARFMLMLLVALYLSADFAVSFAVGLSSGLRCAGWLMLVFPTLHVSYGMGYMRGIFDFVIRRKRPDIATNAIPLSR
ncbi:putative Succinoglycan biosynthesis protein ExoA [Nitrospira defluvii]|jgi:glycosyltransferase involved in cell wall biosynthesis|uniref:Putative Succinoglycan biosynthesis protein ExoA n=1 Tax=Nitrospira defluvii TaxID=330214 RepID=D8PBN9_9BACT|nr:putative Succinoglycan biosynthesis protein ExoA [Nitrospira defluvii]